MSSSLLPFDPLNTAGLFMRTTFVLHVRSSYYPQRHNPGETTRLPCKSKANIRTPLPLGMQDPMCQARSRSRGLNFLRQEELYFLHSYATPEVKAFVSLRVSKGDSPGAFEPKVSPAFPHLTRVNKYEKARSLLAALICRQIGAHDLPLCRD